MSVQTRTAPVLRHAGTAAKQFRQRRRAAAAVITISCDQPTGEFRTCTARHRVLNCSPATAARARQVAAESGWHHDPASRRDLCPTHRPDPQEGNTGADDHPAHP